MVTDRRRAGWALLPVTQRYAKPGHKVFLGAREMNWTKRIVLVPCASPGCNTSVKVRSKQQSDAIITLGKNPYCPECLQRVRDSFTVVEVEKVEW